MRWARTMRAPMLYFAVVGAVAIGCGDKKKSAGEGSRPGVAQATRTGDKAAPPIPVGLAAVPASARVVMGANVNQLADSKLVRRAVGQMFGRDPGLQTRIDDILSTCAIDPSADVGQVVIGMGQGDGEVVLVASGNFKEAALSACLNKTMAEAGGRFSSKPVGDRTFYFAKSEQRGVWLSVEDGAAVAVSPSEEWLGAAVGPGPKLADNPELMNVVGKVRQDAALWAAGQVPDRVGQGLVKSGAVKNPPSAMFAQVELSDGVAGELGVIMSDADDAKSAATKAIAELMLGSLVAQRFSLGRIVNKIDTRAEGSTVHLRLVLTPKELESVISKLEVVKPEVDSGGLPEQDSAGSNTGN